MLLKSSPTISSRPSVAQNAAKMSGRAISVVVPVYGNEESIPDLMTRLATLYRQLNGELEVIVVVDGSPDNSLTILQRDLPSQPFPSKLIAHSRNFGSFAAIRTGMQHVDTPYFTMMAADLQEPAELVLSFYEVLTADRADVVVGVRRNRADGGASRLASRLFWGAYRRLVQREVPSGGVDMFGGNRKVLETLLALDESSSSLVGLVFWIGFRRETIEYDRLEREHGSSGWTLRKKLRYLADSVFSFTDLPIRALLAAGMIGTSISLIVGVGVAVARIAGWIVVPGYTATILTIAFFAGLNLFGLGIIGAYVWRTFENTKQRPLSIVMSVTNHNRTSDA